MICHTVPCHVSLLRSNCKRSAVVVAVEGRCVKLRCAVLRWIAALCHSATMVHVSQGNARRHTTRQRSTATRRGKTATPSPPTKSFDFRKFDSSKLLILKGGNSHAN